MAGTDPRIDAYIAARADFARPILERLRADVHAACPGVEENMRWGAPFFDYRGRPMAMMAAFKGHCSFGFWHGKEVADRGRDAEAMGQFGRIATLADLPIARELRALVKKAMALIDAGAKAPRAPKTGDKKQQAMVKPPDDLVASWRRNAAARRGFENLAPSKQREYVEWIAGAKRDETRARRIAQAVEWLAEGKSRNWQYERS